MVLKGMSDLLFAAEVGVFYAILAVEQCTAVKLDVGASQALPPLVSAGTGSHLNENFHRGLLRRLLRALPVAAPTSWLAA